MVKLRRATLCLLALVMVCQSANLEVRAAQSDPNDLSSQLEKARKKSNRSEEASCLYQLGVKEFEAGNSSKAEVYFRQALEIEDKENLTKTSGFIPTVHTRCALAQVLISINRVPEAAAVSEEALERALKLGEKTEAAKLSKQLGAIYVILTQNDKALEMFNKAIALSKESDCLDCQIDAYTELALLHRVKRNFAESIRLLNEAEKLSGKEGDSLLSARVTHELGNTYSDLGYSDRALAEYMKAAKEYQESGDPMFFGRVLTSIGEIQVRLHRAEKAEKNLEKAAELLETNKDFPNLANCYSVLGSAKADLGKFDQAREFHKKAEALALKLGRKDDELSAITELGYDYYLEGSPEKSLTEFLRAKKFISSNKVSAERQARILTDCGFGYRAVGQIQAAMQMYDEAAKAYSEANNFVQQASMLDSIAVAYLDQGQLEEFEKYHKKAMDTFDRSASEDVVESATTSGASSNTKPESSNETVSAEKSKARLNEQRTRVGATLAFNYAQYCQIAKKYPEAIASFEKALTAFESVEDSTGQCQVLKGLGLTNFNLGQTQKAQTQFERASLLAEKIGNMEMLWDCATGLGKVYKVLGDRNKAEEQYEKAVAIAEKERRQFSRDSFKTAALNLREGCFLDLIDLLVVDNKFDKALEIAEKGRARAFLDMLERRTQSESRDRVAAVVTDDLLEGGKQAERPKLQVAMASSTPGFRSVSVVPKTPSLVEASALSPVNAKAPNLDELRSLVSANHSYFLEYVALPDKIIVWVVKPDGTIAGVKTVNIAISTMKDLITNTYNSIVSAPKGVEDLHKLNAKRQENLSELYGLLIKPVESLLPTNPEDVMTVVPYGPLFQVPFAALVNDKGRYLIEDHTLSYLPAIGVLRATSELKRDVAGLKKSLLAFGNPITQANEFLGKLPYSEKEVNKVASLFDKSLVNVAVGASATKSNFRKSAPGFTYIHLATHGLINQAQPMDSAVVLAPEGGDDGLLTVKDILQLPPLKADLVVLSACQTGKGKIASDGVVGLSRAFVIAGTPSIMVSLWNVDDVMTEYQMENLYYELLKGASKAKALRAAQLKTITFMEKGLTSSFAEEENDTKSGAASKAPKERANPRYWAAFELLGEHG